MKLEVSATPGMLILTPETKDEWKLLVKFEGGTLEMPQYTPGGALYIYPQKLDLSGMTHIPMMMESSTTPTSARNTTADYAANCDKESE